VFHLPGWVPLRMDVVIPEFEGPPPFFFFPGQWVVDATAQENHILGLSHKWAQLCAAAVVDRPTALDLGGQGPPVPHARARRSSELRLPAPLGNERAKAVESHSWPRKAWWRPPHSDAAAISRTVRTSRPRELSTRLVMPAGWRRSGSANQGASDRLLSQPRAASGVGRFSEWVTRFVRVGHRGVGHSGTALAWNTLVGMRPAARAGRRHQGAWLAGCRPAGILDRSTIETPDRQGRPTRTGARRAPEFRQVTGHPSAAVSAPASWISLWHDVAKAARCRTCSVPVSRLGACAAPPHRLVLGARWPSGLSAGPLRRPPSQDRAGEGRQGGGVTGRRNSLSTQTIRNRAYAVPTSRHQGNSAKTTAMGVGPCRRGKT